MHLPGERGGRVGQRAYKSRPYHMETLIENGDTAGMGMGWVMGAAGV